MKNLILFLIIFISLNVNGQTSLTLENNFGKSINLIGIEHNKSNIGYFLNVGTNLFERVINLPNYHSFIIERDFNSTVGWYTENGSLYPVYPNEPLYTSSLLGNVVLEQGSVTNTVHTWTTNTKITYSVINGGFVVPLKNKRIRLGVGIYQIKEKGQTEYKKISLHYSVTKYYDEWEVIGNSNHNFVVAGAFFDEDIPTVTEITPIDSKNTKVNYSIGIEFRPKSSMGYLILGIETLGGINVGFGYNIK